MHIILDANIWLSYFASKNNHSPIAKLIHVIHEQNHQVLMPPDLKHEIITKLATKKRLAKDISMTRIEKIFHLINTICSETKLERIPIRELTRDVKDDYLINYAIEYEVKFIITWDKDLLILKNKLPHLQILSPTEFLKINIT